MKHFRLLVWLGYLLAVISIIVGIIDKIAGFIIFSLGPLSYMRFSGLCLLFVISVALVQLAMGKKE